MPRVPANERRAELVQAAIQVATREGLAATTTRRIARELDISVGIVHYCFRSKEELLHEVIRVIAEAQVVAARS
ncbi:MAG TPA: TetR family transcriptional regulator, partial [Kribbella sp.]